MSRFYFKYKRVVLVDSADLCYAEIPLDEHAILLGEGNVGKSSILNSLRLFLLPEVNFANCKSKFAFRSKDTYYSKDDSFQHYFPSSRSFLILEIENFTGTHCQILYREKGYQYRRIFVPLKYDQLRPFFWYCCDDEKGIGHAVDGLSSSSLIKKIRKIAPDSLFVSDSEKLKQILYANDFLNDSNTRFSLFPLIEQEPSKIDSLRALFLLLFDMNANNKAMIKAIANIIEADKKSANDILDFNIDEFLTKHEQLEEEDKLLTLIKNKKNDFNTLKNNFTQYTSLSDSDKRYIYFIKELEHQKEQALQETQEVDKQIQPLQDEATQLESVIKKATEALAANNTEIKVRKEDLKQSNYDLKKSEEIHQQFFMSMSIEEAIQKLKSDFTENNNKLKTLLSEIEAEKRRKELIMNIDSNNKKLKSFEESSQNQQYLLSKQLPESIVDTLLALNKKLIQANPKRELKPKEIDDISQFVSLFRQSDNGYQWFDILFDRQSINIDDDMEEQYLEVKGQLEKDKEELKSLQQPSGSFGRQQDIQALESAKNDINHKLDVLEKHPVAKSNLEKDKILLEGLGVDKKNFEAELEIAEISLENVTKQLAKILPKQAELKANLEKIVSLDKQCEVIRRSFPRLQENHKNIKLEVLNLKINKETLDRINDELREFDELRITINQALRLFITDKIIQDENNINVDNPSAKMIEETFNRLQEIFKELPQKRHLLDERINTHNQSVSQYTQVLGSHAEHINLFEGQLNREFQNITINDLEKIEVNIEIDRRFKNLVAEINKADLYSERPLSERFYERLKIFVNTFFKDKTDTRLTMDKIVTGLHYRIKKMGNSNWQDKKQSNSTTALINLELVQLLLQRIKKSGCAVTFPLIHDELADININQFDWLLPHLTKQGFKLFSAATNSASTELIHKVKNHHEIGSMKTAKSYSPERTIVYWGGAETFLESDEARKMGILFTEQSSLDLEVE